MFFFPSFLPHRFVSRLRSQCKITQSALILIILFSLSNRHQFLRTLWLPGTSAKSQVTPQQCGKKAEVYLILTETPKIELICRVFKWTGVNYRIQRGRYGTISTSWIWSSMTGTKNVNQSKPLLTSSLTVYSSVPFSDGSRR